MNHPHIEIETAYLVLGYKRRGNTFSVLRFDIDEDVVGVASSLEKAVDIIRDESLKLKYLFFRVYLVPKDRPIAKCNLAIISEWLYDKRGTLLDCCLTSMNELYGDSVFHGRSEDCLRFNKGDIVEFSIGNGLHTLGVVIEVPPSPQRVEVLRQKGCLLDDSDDSYIVLTSADYMKGHHHVRSVDMFEPHFKVPSQTRRRLERIYAAQ